MNVTTQIDDDIQQDAFPARLRQVVDAYGSVTALAKAIGRSDGAVRKWLRGISEPNVSDIRAICALTGANVDWLLMGRGEYQLVVQEPPGLLPPQKPIPMNYGLLENIMDTVDNELRSSGLEIASTKRSTIVATLYGLFRDAQLIDRDAVARLVKLAA